VTKGKTQPVSLSAVEDGVFSVELTNKKDARYSLTHAQLLKMHGYKMPAKWANPARVRPFIAWDGEGITYAGAPVQSYVLFGASTGDRVMGPSLSTSQCFDLLLRVEADNPDAIHVGFALQYDCNMMFRDLERKHLYRLYKTHKVRWNGYWIEYRPGKWLNIRKGAVTVRLFDVWGFFQSSFVTACERFLSSDDPELVAIREGKQARRTFTYEQLEPFIVPYWEGELRLLVRLMDSLRDDLDEAQLPIRSWHGPGAVANTVFRTNNVRSAMAETPKEVNRAAQYAYAGGRFELFKVGAHKGSVWEYDINSAYPTAIATLPNLAKGSWQRVESFQPERFGVWHILYDQHSSTRAGFTKPYPLFNRDRNGNVAYPPFTEGWYWTPESRLVPERYITHGYVFIPDDDDDRPFSFVPEMYETRQQWKQQGKSAEKALKLALNSLYGKMAQRTGWLQEGDPIPRWHQLEWAGYVTSMTRATLWDAIYRAGQSIIAVETDAVFTSKPLSLPTGTGLGQWSVEQFDDILYLQSGMYYAHQGDKLIEKYRGFDKGSVPYTDVVEYLSRYDQGIRTPLVGVTTRFIGMGVGLFTKKVWRSWSTEPRSIAIGGGGKRAHVPALCPQCKQRAPISECLHTLAVLAQGGTSHPHSLPWLEASEPALRELDELERW